MKIVCTGYGVIAPNTTNIEQYVSNLEKGVCSLEIVECAGPNNETNIVGFVKEGLEQYELDRKINRLPRVTKLGIVAAKEAMNSANIDIEDKRIGVFFGISLGASGEELYQNTIKEANDGNYKKIPITFTHYANMHSITASIAHFIDVKGVVKTITTGCTASMEAIEDALLYLKSGKIDVAIVGGTDSPISIATTYAFTKTKVLPLNQELNLGAVPFCERSLGFAMSEAAGVIVLEREEDAIKRKAHIKGEVVDVISNNDGNYIFSLDIEGEQMLKALKEITTNRNPDYINSQALGIQVNDKIEEKCSKQLFEHRIPYTSIKSMYGNPFGSIGILQVISSLLSIQYGFIPPTIRTNKQGYENMNIIRETTYQEVKEVAITNHGYGGNNACAYIKKYDYIK
ncbi:beta-ketoacyl-[acyl-carrier-protein] synthase family protein [Aquibacillus rhizosphaerae]|uniref:Beta-ketoacyl synthase N-terminal-like domain-containing protein n=1 Tax=Aquibacillus rhizosphaerae TaxID=3051431 RepID=A0ABT7L7E0_9BACI|nr:beta-ketoacyl synthase N-terminal-like domain-containing protein [Aquibacillus sp. LR5S19]MDL4841773.1 beta-ketoacyl synthase N-terminal-like domain-containing protein [Aquibacillus sp. LR5S19]